MTGGREVVHQELHNLSFQIGNGYLLTPRAGPVVQLLRRSPVSER
jgi:hypothetical protein